MSEYDDIVTDISRQNNAATVRTIGGFDTTPDNAKRAIDLGKSTGQNPNVILGDIDNVDESHKRRLAGALVSGNSHLADYINSNPIHSALSNDDLGQLDDVSTKLTGFRRLTGLDDRGALSLPRRAAEGIISAGAKGFAEGFGEGTIGQWVTTVPQLKDDRMAQSLWAATGTPVEVLFRTLGGGIHALTEATKAGTKEVYQTFTGDPQGADKFARDIAGMMEQQLSGQGVHGAMGEAATAARLASARRPGAPMLDPRLEKAAEVLATGKLWLNEGKEPLPGVHPEFDKIKLDQNNADIKKLDDLVRSAEQSATRERDPETFANFIRMRDEGTISVSGEAAVRLYGDKLPEMDDGLLGFHPTVAAQLELARRSGIDVEIPLSDFLARIDPEVYKALKDDIRVRPGAITKNEAKFDREQRAEGEGPRPPPLPEDMPSIRAASALEPMFSLGDRNLKIEKRPTAMKADVFGADQWRILDEKGGKVGHLELTPHGDKLYVDVVQGLGGLGPTDFGPALMRSLLRQIKEAYPEAKQIGGFRISGARERAGAEAEAWIKLDRLDNIDYNRFKEILEGGQWETYSPNIKGYVKPDFLRAEEDRQLVDIVTQELDRIVPKKAAIQGVDTAKVEGKLEGQRTGEDIKIGGAYIRYRDSYPLILYALDGENALGAARHEAIHHLRGYGFFTKEEWFTLEAQALAGGWLKKYGIDRRYPEANPSLKLEEAIAEAYMDWAKGEKAPTPEVHGLFERMKAFFEAIKERISQLLGKEATWEDVFAKVDTGEIGSREGTKPLDARSFDERAQVIEPEEPSRIFERANALGMTIDQYKRYEKLIDKRHTEDIAAAERRVGEAQRRQQTKEWKANRVTTRSEVADSINFRPDIAADNYFADGILYGEKVERVKLGTDYLTEEQRALLPRDYYNKAGVAPDELAGLFGFPDGPTFVQHLSDLSAMRRASGMRPIEFKRRLIDIETDRQMAIKYGNLEANILDAVKEQVASETQLSILAEETIVMGIRSGKAPAFDKEAIKAMVQEQFEQSLGSSVSSDKYLAAAGRAGKAAEMALLKDKPAEAFKAKQDQFYATLLAREAIQFEAQTAKFEKLAGQLSRREVKAVEPEYLDFIHQLMAESEIPVKRTAEEIASSKTYYGNEGLAEFVANKANEGWDLAVSEALQNGETKPLDQMSVSERRDFMDAITSLNHVGRAVRKIEIAGEKKEFAEFRDEVIKNIQELPVRSRESQNRWFYKVDASLTRMEELAKDLDLRKELGPLHQAVIEPMMRSKAKEFDLMTDLSKHFQETRGEFGKQWRKSLNDTINQDVLHDPYTKAPYDMTRENLIQVMLNWGNRSNIKKFVQGAAIAKWGRRLDREEFGVFEGQIKGLIDKHATKQDWDFVQRMWQPFKGWQEQMTDVSRSTSGVAPKLIEMAPVETPHGTFEGGYWPVKYDRLGSNAAVIADRRPAQEGVFGGDYFRAATSKGYLKERTGYTDFVDISTSLEQAAGTMQQTIHDIAFRDSLIQSGRVFYDKSIRAAIRKHYGAEYEAQLVPWLRRIANQFSTDDTSISGYNDFMRRVRINLVGHALPLNLKVILSPDVGVPNPKAWASYLANRGDNLKLAMEKSDEIRHLVYNMDRDFRESLDRVTLDPKISDFQKKAVQWGFGPIAKVSQEFRVSTFVDQYHKALGRGKTEQEAALIADSFVRERHGAASVVDLPAIMQSNEAMKMLTMFYGYFNTMYNWQRQLPGNVRRGEAKEFAVNGLGSVVVGAAFGAVLFNQRKEDDSWFKVIAKAMLLQPLSTIPVLREAANYSMEGFQPRSPFASLLGAAGSIYTDAKKYSKGQRIEKPITHAANVVGLATGLPLAQVGRTAQFGADVLNNRQRPKNMADWARGIITGESKLKK